MSSKLTRKAFEQLIEEDIEWLQKHSPDHFERSHIESILKESPEHYYSPESVVQLSQKLGKVQAMLREMEQRAKHPSYRGRVCLICHGQLDPEFYGANPKLNGHAPDCRLAAALKDES